jgi:hypothetical protein
VPEAHEAGHAQRQVERRGGEAEDHDPGADLQQVGVAG